MLERRRFPRKSGGMVCHAETAQGRIYFDSRDVSLGGAFLVSDVLFRMGDKMHLELGTPTANIRTEATVVWAGGLNHGSSGMGVRFELPGEQGAVLEEYLEMLP